MSGKIFGRGHDEIDHDVPDFKLRGDAIIRKTKEQMDLGVYGSTVRCNVRSSTTPWNWKEVMQVTVTCESRVVDALRLELESGSSFWSAVWRCAKHPELSSFSTLRTNNLNPKEKVLTHDARCLKYGCRLSLPPCLILTNSGQFQQIRKPTKSAVCDCTFIATDVYGLEMENSDVRRALRHLA